MFEFQALKLPYHQIIDTRLKILCSKEFDAVVIQIVKALTDLRQHTLNICKFLFLKLRTYLRT